MYRRITLMILFVFLLSGCTDFLKPTGSDKIVIPSPAELNLNCTIISADYRGIHDILITKKVKLIGLKHQPNGAVKVASYGNFDFWVMIYGMKLDGVEPVIMNFQVAIKDRRSDQFMHALSDTSFDKNKPPQMARISLVEYHPNSMVEKGELLFECTICSLNDVE